MTQSNEIAIIVQHNLSMAVQVDLLYKIITKKSNNQNYFAAEIDELLKKIHLNFAAY